MRSIGGYVHIPVHIDLNNRVQAPLHIDDVYAPLKAVYKDAKKKPQWDLEEEREEEANNPGPQQPSTAVSANVCPALDEVVSANVCPALDEAVSANVCPALDEVDAEAEDIEVTPRAVQRRLRGKQKEPPLLGTSEDRKRKAREDQETARKEGKKSAENDELEDRDKAKQPTNSAPSEVQNVNPYDARSKVHCAPSESKDGTINGATSSSSSSSRVVQTNPRRLSTKSSSNNKVTVTKRKASDDGGGRNKAREEDAIKRILNTREAEAPKAPDDETDEELIELCWQDLLTDGASQGDRAASEDKFDEANSKRPRCNEPDFDQDPKLPGDSSTTSAISARLWSESRGLRRISIDKHTAIQEGKQSENFAKRTRGASSERASKVHKGTALRIQHDDMHVIHRLIKQGTATSSSGHPRDIDAGSCSSNAGLGGFLKKPP